MKKIIICVLMLMAIGGALSFFGVIAPDTAVAGLSLMFPAMGFAALTEDRDTDMRQGDSIHVGVAAAKKIYKGSLVAIDALGFATPGAVATTLLGAGRAEETVDNSGGLAEALSVPIRKGIFKFANSAAADLIADKDIGVVCYIVDDQTVALTDAGATRSVAGYIFKVDSDGVWVKFD